MTITATQQQIAISDTLRLMIESFADHYTNSKDMAARIIAQATQEHVPANIVRDMITAALRQRHLSRAQIYRAIPAEFKNQARAASRAAKGGSKVRQLPDLTMRTKELVSPVHYLKVEPCYFLDIVPFVQDRRSFYLRCQGGAVMAVLDAEQYNAIRGAENEND